MGAGEAVMVGQATLAGHMVALEGLDCCGLGISLRVLKMRDSRVGARGCLRLAIDVLVRCRLSRFGLAYSLCLVDEV
jgi:hypothetical protein